MLRVRPEIRNAARGPGEQDPVVLFWFGLWEFSSRARTGWMSAMMHDDERRRDYLPCTVTEYWPNAARVGGVDLRLRLEIQNLRLCGSKQTCAMRKAHAKVSRAWFVSCMVSWSGDWGGNLF